MDKSMADRTQIISFQGALGAYSHQACKEVFPNAKPLPCNTFEGAISAVQNGEADLAMLPVENSTYGRVADVHQMLPSSGLHIIGEHFVRVHINLWGTAESKLTGIKSAMSHTVLLGQCRTFLGDYGIEPIIHADTAGSAKDVALNNDPTQGALASELAGETYGLKLLAEHIEDTKDNTTRFLVTSPKPAHAPAGNGDVVTTFIFRVRNIPAALYKAMGGFATNGVNMVKLESYMVGGSFTATEFYADVIGHPDDTPLKNALEELAYFTDHLEILGVYAADGFRKSV
jgi:prephenate dehydratase